MRPNETMVTLVDGSQVSNYSEAWRHETEARAILAMPSLRARRAHLYGEYEHIRIGVQWVKKQRVRGIAQTRGDAEVQRLEATMTALWEARRKRQAAMRLMEVNHDAA